MISVGAVRSVGYYTDCVGGGRENYYLDAVVADGEPPGYWSGELAESIGLRGEVDADTMASVFEGFEAPDGTTLGQAPAQYRSVEDRIRDRLALEPGAIPERVEAIRREVEARSRTACHGVDLTFSVPKSVTVAWTAAHRAELEAIRSGQSDRAEEFGRIRSGIESAISTANDAAIRYASTLTVAMVGKGPGRTWRQAPGLVVASFVQHTAREDRSGKRGVDPQLHTHNVILNRARCIDGSIRALDGGEIRAQRGAVSAVADRVLGEQLAALGIAMETRPDGKAREVPWIPSEVRDLFSARRRGITRALEPRVQAAEERLGRELTALEVDRLAREVTLATRAGKSHDGESTEDMLDRWQANMREELGAGLVPLAEVARSAVMSGPVPAGRWSPTAVMSAAVAAVSASESTWRRSDLMREIELRLPCLGGLSAEDTVRTLETLTDQAVEGAGVAQVTGIRTLTAPVATSDHRVAPGAVRYASTDSLVAEHALREAGKARGRYSLDAARVGEWLRERFPTIGADQLAAAQGIASTDAAVSMLVGPAGAGKTFSVGALSAAWGELSEGGRVVGLATSQIAAQVLQGEGVPVTANITAFINAQERLARGSDSPGDVALRLTGRDVILIDEASMVDLSAVERIREAADAAGARVVLAGDPRQLGSIGAGGCMDLVDGHADTFHLTEVRRFHEEWEAAASLRLRDGDLSALDEYDRRGRLISLDTLDDAVASAARASAADRLEGLSTMVLTGTNEEASLAAAAVRDHLVAAGVVDESGINLPLDGTVAGVGDVVMTRVNDYTRGVLNRDTFVIRSVGDDGSLTVEAATAPGHVVTLSREYVEASVQSAYAATIHAAEGVTLDTGHLLTDGSIDAAGNYVGLSRGKHRNTAHVACAVPEVDRAPGVQVEDARPSARAVLGSVVERERSDTSALILAERDRARETSLDNVAAMLEHGLRYVTRERLERHLDTLVVEGTLSPDDRARFTADQATEYLSRVICGAERTGIDPQEALRRAVGERELPADGSVAKVIASRVTAVCDLRDVTPGTPTADVPGEWADHLTALRAVVDERRETLGREVVEAAPRWAVETFGPVPDDPMARLEWQERAGSVAAAREATGWSDERVPLDAAPGVTAPVHRDLWDDAWTALDQPEAWRDEATLSEGQLQVRVEAWNREKTWAPPFPDDALRHAEMMAEETRVSAVLGDGDRTESDGHRETARSLETAVEGRREWAQSTFVTRTTGERAAVELERRGITPGREADRVTAEEWLAADRAARLADDPHRTIGEADVTDHDQTYAVGNAVTDTVTDPAMERLPESPTRTEVEAATVAAVAAIDKVRDRQSQESAHTYDAAAAGGSYGRQKPAAASASASI